MQVLLLLAFNDSLLETLIKTWKVVWSQQVMFCRWFDETVALLIFLSLTVILRCTVQMIKPKGDVIILWRLFRDEMVPLSILAF